jgi:hypothetical protein
MGVDAVRQSVDGDRTADEHGKGDRVSWVESKVSIVGVIAGLAGTLLGTGVSLGTAYTRLGAIEERLGQIEAGLRERTETNAAALASLEVRTRMLEIEIVRIAKDTR